MGYYEKDDLACVIDYLRKCGFIGPIGLWGRSMGAVTSLLHADRDPTLACLVLDSPFTNLRKLAMELVESGHYLRLGGMLTTWVVDACMHFIKGILLFYNKVLLTKGNKTLRRGGVEDIL